MIVETEERINYKAKRTSHLSWSLWHPLFVRKLRWCVDGEINRRIRGQPWLFHSQISWWETWEKEPWKIAQVPGPSIYMRFPLPQIGFKDFELIITTMRRATSSINYDRSSTGPHNDNNGACSRSGSTHFVVKDTGPRASVPDPGLWVQEPALQFRTCAGPHLIWESSCR